MAEKNSNEITVKIISSKEKLVSLLKKQDFSITRTFFLDDYYFIPEALNTNNMSPREILAKAIIIRNIFENDQYIKKITFKIKEIDEAGNILNQKAINCNVTDITEAKQFIQAIGYKEIMNIRENNVVYSKDDLELAIKEIENGDLLLETETNSQYDTIEKLKSALDNLQIEIEPNQYFVKKAEIELDKILKNNL